MNQKEEQQQMEQSMNGGKNNDEQVGKKDNIIARTSRAPKRPRGLTVEHAESNEQTQQTQETAALASKRQKQTSESLGLGNDAEKSTSSVSAETIPSTPGSTGSAQNGDTMGRSVKLTKSGKPRKVYTSTKRNLLRNRQLQSDGNQTPKADVLQEWKTDILSTKVQDAQCKVIIRTRSEKHQSKHETNIADRMYSSLKYIIQQEVTLKTRDYPILYMRVIVYDTEDPTKAEVQNTKGTKGASSKKKTNQQSTSTPCQDTATTLLSNRGDNSENGPSSSADAAQTNENSSDTERDQSDKRVGNLEKFMTQNFIKGKIDFRLVPKMSSLTSTSTENDSTTTTTQNATYTSMSKIQFADVSYRKYYAFRFEYYAPDDLAKPIIVHDSPKFQIFARKQTEPKSESGGKKRTRARNSQSSSSSSNGGHDTVNPFAPANFDTFQPEYQKMWNQSFRTFLKQMIVDSATKVCVEECPESDRITLDEYEKHMQEFIDWLSSITAVDSNAAPAPDGIRLSKRERAAAIDLAIRKLLHFGDIAADSDNQATAEGQESSQANSSTMEMPPMDFSVSFDASMLPSQSPTELPQ